MHKRSHSSRGAQKKKRGFAKKKCGKNQAPFNFARLLSFRIKGPRVEFPGMDLTQSTSGTTTNDPKKWCAFPALHLAAIEKKKVSINLSDEAFGTPPTPPTNPHRCVSQQAREQPRKSSLTQYTLPRALPNIQSRTDINQIQTVPSLPDLSSSVLGRSNIRRVNVSPLSTCIEHLPRRVSFENQSAERNVWKLHTIPKNTSPLINSPFVALLQPQDARMKGRNTLVVDLDETLVFSTLKKCPCDADLEVRSEGVTGHVYVRYRPFLLEFLDFVSQLFEVVVFTASSACYAEVLLDRLEKEVGHEVFSARLYRDHCTTTESGEYVKDLMQLGRPLSRVVMLDNLPGAYTYQKRNALPISSFVGDPFDNELRQLLKLMARLAECETVFPLLDAHSCVV